MYACIHMKIKRMCRVITNILCLSILQVLSLHLVTVERPIEEDVEKMESTLLTLDVGGRLVSSAI